MQVLVLGTSNSIKRDRWLLPLQESSAAFGINCDNQSVGASTSLYLAYRLHDLSILDKVDRVIIDFCINDQIYIEAGIYDVNRAEGHYMAAFRQLAERNMLSKTIVLLFPQLHFATSGDVCPLIERIRVLCQQFGVRTVDAGPLVAAAAEARGENVALAYSDPRHFAADYQRVIGTAVLREVRRARFPVSLRSRLNRRSLLNIPLGCIRPLRIQPLSQVLRVNVGTSLARWDVWSMPHQTKVKVGGGRWLLGVFHWSHANSGAFCLKGPGQTRRFHLRRTWVNLFLFDDVSPPFLLHGGAEFLVANDLQVPYTVLQGQHSSVYNCAGATVDLVALVGSDLSPEDLFVRGARCHAFCAMPVWRRIVVLTRRRFRTLANQMSAKDAKT